MRAARIERFGRPEVVHRLGSWTTGSESGWSGVVRCADQTVIMSGSKLVIFVRQRMADSRVGAGLQPRQDDQVDEGVDKQADRECVRADPDGPLSEALTGCNQE
jgi:hypothetical protein